MAKSRHVKFKSHKAAKSAGHKAKSRKAKAVLRVLRGGIR